MTKDAIKQTALKLFAKQGYESTSMREIANEVGLKAPSIYAHFVSKEEIYIQLAEESSKEYTSVFSPFVNCSFPIQNLDIGGILFHIFKDTIQFFLNDRDKGMLWLRSQIFPPRLMENSPQNHINLWEASFQNNCRPIFSKGISLGQIKDMDLQLLTDSYRSFILGYMISLLSFNTISEESNLQEAWLIYWRGIAS
ncbi:MAG: bacterial regulatory s, tetR family protein [Anaerosolibacter sp.]|uniref:TetR/AcrR family transcriptional regulator n=1 Tax=Anaerosolibacter sp. TaxID=1872527 RepID=UPI00263161B5|nr:TetR/AcrR family transcriptional regulator [Anaerosolibacter sp.]MDF2548612.1 bacterial regulatory s, tetR family protein [Anaerosolibacter sp.]